MDGLLAGGGVLVRAVVRGHGCVVSVIQKYGQVLRVRVEEEHPNHRKGEQIMVYRSQLREPVPGS